MIFCVSFGDVAELDVAVDFGHDRRLAGFARFEELDDARQTAGDVFGLGGFTRNLGDDVAGGDLIAIRHHQVRADRHLSRVFSTLPAAFLISIRGWRFSSGESITMARLTGHFVDFFVNGHAFFQILLLNLTADFGQNREGKRIPFCQHLILLDPAAVWNKEVAP